jgi:anion-transporting  ArsA/GET3 family ATPase
VKDLIEQHRVVVCTGSGGVGKTTTAAALGVAAARAGKRVLVLTIDPARRLATTLGIADRAEDTLVPGQSWRGELWAGAIDPPRIFADYIERHARSRETVERLTANALYRQLSTTLSGSQEFTSLARLHDAATSGAYDLVILDTPPAAHAADFLHAPERLNAVFDSAVVSLFMGRTAGLGLASAAWKRGVGLVLGALSMLTGSAFVATFKDFFAAIDAIAPDIRETNLQAHRLLLDPSTAFVLVSSFDSAKMQEGEAFRDELVGAGYHLRKVVVNRAWPQWAPADATQRAAQQASLRALGKPTLSGLHERLCDYYAARRALPARFADVVTVPELDGEITGLKALERLAGHLMRPA